MMSRPIDMLRCGSAAWIIGAVLLVGGLHAGCERPPDRAEMQTTVDYYFQPNPDDRNTRNALLEDIKNTATDRIRAALAGDMLTEEVADRLVAADRVGVEVSVVADRDDRQSEPVQTLLDNEIDVTFGDGALTYLPSPNLTQILSACAAESGRERVVCGQNVQGSSPCGGRAGTNQNVMCRPGSFNRMTHRFILIDDEIVWNFARGFSSTDGPLAWRAESEILHEDFGREFRQLAGGTFSTTLDAYNGPLKSTGDKNLDYMTDEGVVQVRFNPQERILKHVIDEVYRARDSVAIVTPVLRNPFLLDALEYKNGNGFDVDIVVGPNQPQGDARSRLQGLGARQAANESLPTIVIVDGKTYAGDKQWPRTALLLSHTLAYSRPYTLSSDQSQAYVYPSDRFFDGTLWKFYEYSSNAGGRPDETGQIDRLETIIERTRSSANPL